MKRSNAFKTNIKYFLLANWSTEKHITFWYSKYDGTRQCPLLPSLLCLNPQILLYYIVFCLLLLHILTWHQSHSSYTHVTLENLYSPFIRNSFLFCFRTALMFFSASPLLKKRILFKESSSCPVTLLTLPQTKQTEKYFFPLKKKSFLMICLKNFSSMCVMTWHNQIILSPLITVIIRICGCCKWKMVIIFETFPIEAWCINVLTCAIWWSDNMSILSLVCKRTRMFQYGL